MTTNEQIQTKDIIRDIYSKAFKVGITRFFLLLLNILKGFLLATILGPSGRGAFAVVEAISSTGTQFGNLGMHTANSYSIGKSPELLPKLLGNSLLHGLGIISAASFITWIFFNLYPSSAPTEDPLLFLALLLIPLSLTSQLLRYLLIGINVSEFNKVALASSILMFLLVLGFSISGRLTPVTASAALLVSLTVTVALTYHYLRSKCNTKPFPSLQHAVSMIPFGIKASLVTLFGIMIYNVDVYMINYYFEPKQVGYYAISENVDNIAFIIPIILSQLLLPKLSGIEDISIRLTITKKISMIVMVLYVFIALIGLIALEPAVKFILGNNYLPSVRPGQILLFASIPASAAEIITICFASLGFPVSIIFLWFFAFITNIAANVFLIPVYGIDGAAFSKIIVYVLLLPALYIYTLYFTGKNKGSTN
jgi:O-antigen/teichoic acid export membrane protein